MSGTLLNDLHLLLILLKSYMVFPIIVIALLRPRQVKSLTHTAHSGFGLRDSDGIDEESEAQRGRVTSPR